MTGSAYIRWAKSRERFRYSIGRSSIRPCPPELLGATLEDLALCGDSAHGWRPLVEAIGDRYRVDPERVVLAIGCSMANHLACAATLEPGCHVLVETPGYGPLHEVPDLLGARVERFARDAPDWRLRAEEIAARLQPETRMVVLSDPHNPSGVLAEPAELEALGRLADEHGFHVLVDEVYREFIHRPGDPFAAGRGERWISTCSLTKAYGLDGLRAGWIIASTELAGRIRVLNDLYGIIMPHPSERLALRALRVVDRLRADVDALLERNRPRVARLIAERPELSWTPPDAGPVGFVRLEGGAVDRLVDELESTLDATVPPGRFFGRDDHFRIGFGMTSPDLDAGLDRLATALDRLHRAPRGGS